jgi:hypothetical protein
MIFAKNKYTSKMGLQIKAKTSIGSLFTAASILISFIGVSINWYQDRELDEAVLAAQYRTLSTEAYGKVMDWKSMNLQAYNEAEILIEEVAMRYAHSKDNILARDQFWLGNTQIWHDLQEETLQKGIKTYHLKLLSHNMDRDSTFVITVNYIDRMLELNRKAYLEETQKAILNHDPSLAAETAVLGNILRGINGKYRDKTKLLFNKQVERLDGYLEMILTQSNYSLVR